MEKLPQMCLSSYLVGQGGGRALGRGCDRCVFFMGRGEDKGVAVATLGVFFKGYGYGREEG